MLDYAPSSETAYEKAQAEGLIVDLPEDNELLLDIDSEEALQQFRQRLPVLVEHFDIIETDVLVTPSKSKGYHVRISLPLLELTPWARIAFQAALGSDPMRELLSTVMVCAGDRAPTLLHEKPETMEKVVEWRKNVAAPRPQSPRSRLT